MNTKTIYAAFVCMAAASTMMSCTKPAPATVVEAPAPTTAHVDMLVKDWERAKKFTKAYIDSSNDKTVAYKLSPKTPRSFGGQLLHLSEVNYVLGKVGTGKPTDISFGSLEKGDKIKTKADLEKAVMDSYDYVIAGIKDMND